jgi:hypothetical protein
VLGLDEFFFEFCDLEIEIADFFLGCFVHD